MPGLVGVLVTWGMVVVAPLGPALLSTPGLDRLRRAWPVLGALAGAGMWRSRPPRHGVNIATPSSGRTSALRELTALTAAGSSSVAALSVVALSVVAQRAGVASRRGAAAVSGPAGMLEG